MSVRFVHVGLRSRGSFPSQYDAQLPTCSTAHLPIPNALGCRQVWANLNNVSLNILTNSPSGATARTSLGCLSGRGTAERNRMQTFNFTRQCQFFSPKCLLQLTLPPPVYEISCDPSSTLVLAALAFILLGSLNGYGSEEPVG